MTEKLKTIIALVSSLIATLSLIYDVCLKKERKRLELYYEKVLKKFVIAYQKNKNINVVEFVKSIVCRKDDSIPTYIFYLIDNNNSEELKKILIYDYIENYKNEYNTMSRIIKAIRKLLIYVIFLSSFVFLFMGAESFIIVILNIIDDFNLQFSVLIQNSTIYLRWIILAIVCLGISIGCLQLTKYMNTDIYTLERKRIKKIISQKVRIYDKKIEKFYI